MMRILSARMLFGIDLFGVAMLRAYVAAGVLIALFGLPKQHPLWICELTETLTNDRAGDAMVALAAKLIFFAGWIGAWVVSAGLVRLLKRIYDLTV